MRKLYRSGKNYLRRCTRFVVRRMFFPLVYYIGCLRNIDPKLVVFLNDNVEGLSDNFAPVMDRLSAEGFRCVHLAKRQGGRIKQYGQLTQYYLLYARARAVFLVEASLLTSCFRPRRGTLLVQLWHGCGAFKKFGHSSVGSRWGASASYLRWFPLNRNYTYACVSSPEVVRHYAEAFGCAPEVIRPWGAPRTDFYFRPGVVEQCRQQVLDAFPGIGQRKIVVYAPTFRGNSMKRARHDDVIDYEAMAAALGENTAFLLKPHPRSRRAIPMPEGETPFIFDAMHLPIEVLLCAADLVITDYSSLIFEYALLGRPMLFYAYDLENYAGARDFYYPYLEFIPGDMVWDSEGLIDGIQRNLFEGKFDAARVEAFREKFMSACDGHSTERILKNVLGI